MSEFPVILATCFGVMTLGILLFIGLGAIIATMRYNGWYIDKLKGEKADAATRHRGGITDT